MTLFPVVLPDHLSKAFREMVDEPLIEYYSKDRYLPSLAEIEPTEPEQP